MRATRFWKSSSRQTPQNRCLTTVSQGAGSWAARDAFGAAWTLRSDTGFAHGARILNRSGLAIFLLALAASAQELTPVVSKPISRTIDLPGEFQPYLSVALHAKIAGYVEKITVDRGSLVKQGDLLVELSAPEIRARIAEAQSKVQVAEADRLQAEAQVAILQTTLQRLEEAAKTPGAVAGNEVEVARRQVDAAQALVRSRQQAKQAAEAAVAPLKDLESYLRITAPFDGVITDRLVHPGALVGPGADPVLVVLQQLSRLRLIAAVPEEDVAGIVHGARVEFKVPAYPGRIFTGTVARLAHTLDAKTRTMPVELDVANKDSMLSPGMYPTVKWPVRRAQPGLFVPRTAIVTTSERTFVIRDNAGRAEWVNVARGVAEGDLQEVNGSLRPGDRIVKRATDEIREGAPLH
jgi:membrane fusion protein (multidrug efflux system)